MDSEDQSLESISSPVIRPRKTFYCNSAICLSYILSVLASLIVVHGTLLYFRTFDRVWLVLPITGIILILIGSCLYRCGMSKYNQSLVTNNRKRHRCKRQGREPNLFQSHLSINMLPQCFSSLDQRILNSNGHRYLVLPIDPFTSQEANSQTTQCESTFSCAPSSSGVKSKLMFVSTPRSNKTVQQCDYDTNMCTLANSQTSDTVGPQVVINGNNSDSITVNNQTQQTNDTPAPVVASEPVANNQSDPHEPTATTTDAVVPQCQPTNCSTSSINTELHLSDALIEEPPSYDEVIDHDTIVLDIDPSHYRTL